MIDPEQAINEAHWAFNDCLSIKEINRQLAEGLIGSVDHARYVLSVWENFKRLPQYAGLKLEG